MVRLGEPLTHAFVAYLRSVLSLELEVMLGQPTKNFFFFYFVPRRLQFL